MTFSLSGTFKKSGALFFDKPIDNLKLGLVFGAVAAAACYVPSLTENGLVVTLASGLAGGVVGSALFLPLQIGLLKQSYEDFRTVMTGSELAPKSSLIHGGLSGLAKSYAQMGLGMASSAAVTVAAVMATQKFIIG